MSERLSVVRVVTWRGSNGTRVLRESTIRPPRLRSRKTVRGLNARELGGGVLSGENLVLEKGGKVMVEDWIKETERPPQVVGARTATQPDDLIYSTRGRPSLRKSIGPLVAVYQGRKV